MNKLTQDRLKQLLTYNPDTGEFVWNAKRHGIKKSNVAGYVDKGYIRIKVDGHTQYAHRLVFLYEDGNLPDEFVDHINRSKSDNRRINLRKASRSENAMNSRWVQRTDLPRNVYLDHGLYRVVVGIRGVNHHIGMFRDLQQAKDAAIAARLRIHGEFMNEE